MPSWTSVENLRHGNQEKPKQWFFFMAGKHWKTINRDICWNAMLNCPEVILGDLLILDPDKGPFGVGKLCVPDVWISLNISRVVPHS